DALDALEPKVADAEAAMQRGAAGLEADKQRMQRIAFEGGHVDVADLEFNPDGTQVAMNTPAGRAALDRVLAFATACPPLRFTIVGHTSRAGDAAKLQALSLTRADAVKKYLITAGVAAEVIEKIDGVGGTQPAVDEPEPNSAAAKQLAPEELAS